MTETFIQDVLIDGNQDTEQLRVQGHTTQNDPLQTWEDSGGNVLAQVTGDGRLQIGDDLGMATPDALLEAHRAEASTTKPTRGIHSLGQIGGPLSSLVQWMVGELELRGSDAISALHTALRIRASNLNTNETPGAGAELRGADIEVINDASAGATAFPKATGLQVGVTNATGKTITDAAAIRVKMNNAGTITNPYAIFAEGPGVVHLEDYLEVKRPSSIPDTPATDFLRLYPKPDGKLYAKNWAGAEFDLTGSGEGGGAVSLLPNGSFEVWENGINTPPDNYFLSGTAASVAREDTLVTHGLFSLKLTRAGTDCLVSRDIYVPVGYGYINNRTFVFGTWIYATVSNRARIAINDGATPVFSNYHPGDSTWRFLTVSITVSGLATSLVASMHVEGGDTSAYFDGATVVEGSSVSQFSPAIMPFNQFPHRATMWHDEAIYVNGSASFIYNSVQMFAMTGISSNLNDAFTHSFWIAEGTYNLRFLCRKTYTQGILSVYIDEQPVGTLDMYSSVNTYNHVASLSNINIKGDGYHVLKGVTTGKNPSATAYQITLTKYWLDQSND